MKDTLKTSLIIGTVVIIFFGGIFLIIDRDSIFHVEKVDWWTSVLCNSGNVYETPGYDRCVNSTGTYRAFYYGKKYYGNHTSSWSPYWHMKQIDSPLNGSGNEVNK